MDFIPVSVLPKTFQDLLTKTEYESFMNIHLWKDILEHHCDRTHSQYGIVAIVRAAMIIVNKQIWKALMEPLMECSKRSSPSSIKTLCLCSFLHFHILEYFVQPEHWNMGDKKNNFKSDE